MSWIKKILVDKIEMHEEYLKRIAEALERAYPNPPDSTFFTKADAFIWKPELKNFEIIKHKI